MKQMISIWFFIGCLLTIYGLLIFYAGIQALSKTAVQVPSVHLHLPIWWGIFMTALGVTYVVRFRPRW
jgi:hypothetical protein